MLNIRRVLFLVAAFIFVFGATCSYRKSNLDKTGYDKYKKKVADEKVSKKGLIDLRERLNISIAEEKKRTISLPQYPKGKYSFKTDAILLQDAIRLFAETFKINLIMKPDVLSSTDTVTISFQGLKFEDAMEAILENYGYYWEYENSVLKVSKFITKSFRIDYLKLKREGAGRSGASLSSGGGAGGSGGSASEGSSISISQSSSSNFWEDLQKQLEGMLSKEGKVTINTASGVVSVTDRYTNVENIEKFVKAMTESIYRQVEIDVKIFEVILNDDRALGIDWSKIKFDVGKGLVGASLSYGANNIPFGVGSVRPHTFTLTYERDEFKSVVTALSEQGKLNVISQPKILVMNNQPALIKAGVDRPYFTRESSSSQISTDVSYSTNYVTVGVVMSVTAQISEDDVIILDVSPVISRLVSISSITDDNNRVLATAPVVEVKQTSTMVRLRDSEMAVIAGMILDQSAESVRRVPILGHIPLLGKLFSGEYHAKSKSELVIFLTPRMVR